MLDTYREVVTPEGVALHLPAAGPVPRALAWAIDLAIRVALMLIGVELVLGLLGRGGYGPVRGGAVRGVLVLPGRVRSARRGQTPGKRALGLRVIAANGAPVGWLAVVRAQPAAHGRHAAVRLRRAAWSPSLADPWGRRLGDMVAGTLVVHDARDHEPRAGAGQPGALPPAVTLLPHEQAALIAFAERAPATDPGRGRSNWPTWPSRWCRRAAPLAVERLYGIANWLLGRR